MMQSNRPKVYGNCAAGCKWEVPHKDDFLSLVHYIGVDDWAEADGLYSHSLTIDRLVDEDIVMINADITAYSECGLTYSQDGKVITFSVTELPTDILTVDIAVIPSTAVREI